VRVPHVNASAGPTVNPCVVGKGSFGEVYKGYHINPPIAAPTRAHDNRRSASINGRGKP